MNESISSVNHKQIGYRIKEVREQNNFSQARLAEETELSISYISHIENPKECLASFSMNECVLVDDMTRTEESV